MFLSVAHSLGQGYILNNVGSMVFQMYNNNDKTNIILSFDTDDFSTALLLKKRLNDCCLEVTTLVDVLCECYFLLNS